MKRPLAGLVLMFALGIWAGSIHPLPLWDLVLLTLTVLLGFCLVRQGRLARPLLLLAVSLAGMLAHQQATTPGPFSLRRLLPSQDQSVQLRGLVVSTPTAAGRFEWRIRALKAGTGWQRAEGMVLGQLTGRTEESLSLRYGDHLEAAVLLRLPQGARNQGGFDQQAWLARRQIHFVAVIGSAADCRVLARGRGHPVWALALRLRERFERALRLGIEQETAVVGVLTGMVIGQREEIPPATYLDFQRAGVLHVFAVSGLHVGLLAMVMTSLLLLCQLPRRWCGLVGIPLLALYVLVTGARPSAVRALVMVSVVLGGWALVRPLDGLNSLAAAALVILVLEPLQLFDGGFQLSVGAVGSLLWLAGPTQQRLRGWLAPDPLIPVRLVPGWRLLVSRGWNMVAKYLACSWAVVLGLLPLMAWYFHLFTPVAVLANLVVVPVLGGIIGLGMLAVASAAVWPWLAVTLNNTNYLLLSLLIGLVDWLEGLPGGHWYVRRPPLALSLLYYGLLAFWSGRARWWPYRRWVGFGCLPLVAGGLWMAARTEPVITLTVLRMEQGSALFLDLPGEQHDWLIDGGGNDGGRELLPFLRAQGVDRLGGILLSCKDKAHASGVGRVLEEIPVRELVVGEPPSRSAAYQRLRTQALQRGITMRTVQAGDGWQIRTLRVAVLNPPRQGPSRRTDDNAVVVLLEYGASRLLLASDIGAAVEERLVQEQADLRAAVLVKGGHGREASGTTAFLQAVGPAWVVLGTGDWDPHRYQDPALPERLQKLGARLWRTDRDGPVRLRLGRRGVVLER